MPLYELTCMGFAHSMTTQGAPPGDESWIDSDEKRAEVRREYRFYVLGYLAVAAASAAFPRSVGWTVLNFWLVPHMVGSAHLRFYQTAEHRACKLAGPVTDTSAWVVSRTTLSWWLYVSHYTLSNSPHDWRECSCDT